MIGIMLVGAGSLDRENNVIFNLRKKLETDPNFKVLKHKTSISEVSECLDDGLEEINKMIILNSAFKSLTDLRTALNDIAQLIDSGCVDFDVLTVVTNSTTYNEVINIVGENTRFKTILRESKALSMSVFRDFCLSSLKQNEYEEQQKAEESQEIERNFEADEESEEPQEDEYADTTQTELPDEDDVAKDTTRDDEDANSRISDIYDNENEEDEEESPKSRRKKRREKSEKQQKPAKEKKSGGLFSKKSKKEKPVEEEETEEPQRKFSVSSPSSGRVARRQKRKQEVEQEDNETKEVRSGLFTSKINLSSKVATMDSGLSANIHMIIAVTGHRGSGVSSTVANLAHTARVLNNLSVCVVNLDFALRSLNNYYPDVQDDTAQYEDINQGLVKAIASPQQYEAYASTIVDSYDMITLGYGYRIQNIANDFTLRDNLAEQPYSELIPPIKLMNLLTFLKSAYNLVIIDFPAEYIKEYLQLLMAVDRIGLCVNNSVRSAVNTVLSVENAFETAKSLHYQTVARLGKLIVTNYNNCIKTGRKTLTPDILCDMLNQYNGEFCLGDLALAGTLDSNPYFDSQLGSDKLICEVDETLREQYQSLLIEIVN